MKIYFIIFSLLIISVFLLSCKTNESDQSSLYSEIISENIETTTLTQKEDTELTETENITDSETGATVSVDWSGVTADGVDEETFIKSLDTNILKEIAGELQTLVDNIQQKQLDDPESVLRGEWVYDITSSVQYNNVLGLSEKAMKPLYWIIYKSDSQGLYEYICSMALEKISGYDLTDADGLNWATSKDFLARFNEKLIEQNT